MAASPLRCGGSPHAAVAVVREMLRIAQARAVRLSRARGAAQAQRERQRGQLRHPGRVGSGLAGLAALAGGTHSVLTESSRGAHGVANGVSRKGRSRGTRRGATHGAAVLGRTNGSRCSGCRRTSVPSAVRVARSTHVALKCPPYCRPCPARYSRTRRCSPAGVLTSVALKYPQYCRPCLDCYVPPTQCPLHSHQRNHIPSVRVTASGTLR